MMKRFFSILLALSLLAIPCLSLTGCHGTTSVKDPEAESHYRVPDTFDTSKPIEIVFWAKNESNKYQTAVYQKAVTEFQNLYPNVTITIKTYNDYTKLYNDVITNLATGTTPNVCITYPDHIATYLTGDGTMVPLNDFMANEKYGLGGSEVLFDSPTVEELVPEFLEECSFDGTYYALPYMRSTEALYINADFVEALGYEVPDILTWDFIWEVSEAATKKNADGTYALNNSEVMIPFIYKSTDNMMISMIRQLDADYSTESGQITIFNDTTKDLLKTISSHVGTGAFSTFSISSYPANFLNAGQCVFAIDSTAGATWMGSKAANIDIPVDQLVDFNIVVRPIPQYDTENPKMISQGPSICIFNKADSQEVLASWLFAQFLLTNDIQIGYSQTEGYAPVTKKAQESAEYREYLSREGEDNDTYYAVKIQATKLLLENTENTFTTPVFNGSASLRKAAGEMIEDVCKAIRRKKTVNDEYIDDLYTKMVAQYHLDVTGGAVAGGTVTEDLGPLPTGAKLLLVTLAVTWILLGALQLRTILKKRKK